MKVNEPASWRFTFSAPVILLLRAMTVPSISKRLIKVMRLSSHIKGQKTLRTMELNSLRLDFHGLLQEQLPSSPDPSEWLKRPRTGKDLDREKEQNRHMAQKISQAAPQQIIQLLLKLFSRHVWSFSHVPPRENDPSCYFFAPFGWRLLSIQPLDTRVSRGMTALDLIIDNFWAAKRSSDPAEFPLVLEICPSSPAAENPPTLSAANVHQNSTWRQMR